ncbi:substrate-binding periplasmic protein [Dongshaea marina]|uniref:substrate-binding periplasmic protein n=1 Tax=Dongshaea marina TaxID=2047966 RepID=UPI000D3E43A3|nr:transporter substrate-binding domain-containing protein [Dongshaea marina]
MRILLLLLILGWGWPSMVDGATRVRLAYSDLESFPYQMGTGSEVADPPGLSIDVIRAATKGLEVQLELKRFPNKRVLRLLESNLIDGAFIFSYNDERAHYAVYPMRRGIPDQRLRVATISYYLYVSSQSSLVWDGEVLESLSGKIGANSGHAIIPLLERLGADVQVTKTLEQNFNKLAIGRLAAVAAQPLTADRYLKENYIEDIRKLYPPLRTRDYFLIFSRSFAKRQPELVKALWENIGRVREPVTVSLVAQYRN